MIETTIAQNILDRLKDIINQELNFFDTEGNIIASTDPNRIGQINHEGAQKAMEEDAPVIIEYESQYRGAKPGINLPVVVNAKTVGAIGITGKKEDILPYGRIIKEMTEVLIVNNTANEILHNRVKLNQVLLSYILQGIDITNIQVNFKTNFDVNLPRIAIIGMSSASLTNNSFSLYFEIEKLLKNDSQHIIDISGNTITILYQTAIYNDAIAMVNKLNQKLSQIFSLRLHFGIGTISPHTNHLKNSIKQAKTALEWGAIHSKENIVEYQKIGYGILLNSISPSDSNYFLEHLFQNLEEDDILKLINLLSIYEKNNGSIQASADELFIHKNTLQYKLNKIFNETGYNPRTFQGFFYLKLGCLLYQMKQNKQK